MTTIDFHKDAIKSIDFCNLNKNLFIITASSDCRVVLHSLLGVKIGVFGQVEQWKLQDKVFEADKPKEQNQEQSKEIFSSLPVGLVTNVIETSTEQTTIKDETDIFSDEDFIKNPSLRYNPWSKTILGV